MQTPSQADQLLLAQVAAHTQYPENIFWDYYLDCQGDLVENCEAQSLELFVYEERFCFDLGEEWPLTEEEYKNRPAGASCKPEDVLPMA